MRSSTKVLLGGVVGAGIVLAVGALNTQRLERRVVELEKQCRAQSDAEVAAATRPPEAVNGPWVKYQEQPDVPNWKLAPLVCDAEELRGVRYRFEPQAAIVDAYRAKTRSEEWPVLAAVLLFSVSALPWAWYFLLRRIGELRDAIGGKPPGR